MKITIIKLLSLIITVLYLVCLVIPLALCLLPLTLINHISRILYPESEQQNHKNAKAKH